MLLPFCVNAYSTTVIPNDPITMPRATPVIDGTIETTGAWSYVARMDEETTSDFWAGRGVVASADIYFAYDTSGIYFAADIADSRFIYTTGYDTINNEGTSYPYGFNGDVFTFMLDPLGRFEKTTYQTVPHYNVGLYSNGNTGIYRSYISESNITSLTKSKALKTSYGWKFEAYIPWSVIYQDVKQAYPSISLTQSRLYASGVTSYASCMYLDRYNTGAKTDTYGRMITVRDITYDKFNGTETNGIDAKTFGLTLINGDAPGHIWNEWQIVTPATCTQSGTQKRTCQTCNQVETQTIPATGHNFGNWVIIKQATATEPGAKSRTCGFCKLTETYDIPALGDNEPIVVAYYNASQITTDEFTNIDVLNYHPAFINYDAKSGQDDVITDNYSSALSALKNRAYAQNPDIKIVFTLMSNNISVFESWFTSHANADLLATKVVKIISDYGFDGFDIDYEFPSSGNYRSANFVYFMAQMRYRLDMLGKTTGKDYILSMAVPGTVWAFSLFDMQSLSDYVNYFNIMDYDISINATYAHHHTAGSQVASDIATYLAYGIPKEKIVVGCGMYALRWTNVSAGTSHGLNMTGTCDYSNLHYSQLLSEYVNKNGYVRYWDDINKAPYLYNSSKKVFISYDDSESVRYKCECVTKNDIGGIMFFDYCTCDGEGLFKNVADWLNLGGTHTHNFVYAGTVNPTCTASGYILYACSCSQTKKEILDPLGHDFGEWVITAQPTTTQTGLKTRSCSRCVEKETEIIPVISGDEISASSLNYNIIIRNAIEPNAIRVAKGNFATSSEIKRADGVRTYSGSDLAALISPDSEIIIPCADEGEYSIWVRCTQGEYILHTELNNFTPTVSVNAITIKLENLSSYVSSVYIAKGKFSTYREIKNNLLYSATSAKFSDKHTLTYVWNNVQTDENGECDISVCLRNTDNTDTILHTKIDIDIPKFTKDGLNLQIENLVNVKSIRRVPGVYKTLSEVKQAGATCYSSSVISPDNTAKIHFPSEGIYTIAVQYRNGYTKIETFDVEKKVPDFKFENNTVTIGNLDGFHVIRYAKGNYSSTSAIKKAPGSKALQESALGASGIITISNLKPGEYTFAVQYKDESISIYHITVE